MNGLATAAVLITLIVMAALICIEWISHRTKIHRPDEYVADPEQVLAERFARGEIEEAEYARRLSTLRMGPAAELLFPRD
jgi:putative membrane protein